MNPQGKLLVKDYQPDLDLAKKIYMTMVKTNVFDLIMYEAQRQGRISFFMTSFGEEAAIIASFSAWSPNDLAMTQYREHAGLFWRGATIPSLIDQCFGTEDDITRGRQMPVHYSRSELSFFSISSPLGTQLPQASGAAYALKLKGIKDQCVVAYFGEGAASEGDFHAGLNFAATLNCPVIFFCRNNGYAISTPAAEQYRSDGISARGYGYGIDSIRVDGNDIWAVREACLKAREIAITENRPILIEAITYRVGHHSTSDDSTKYRTREEIDGWGFWSPIRRLRTFLEERGLWNEQQEVDLRNATRKEVLESVKSGERKLRPAIKHLFTDVYDQQTPILKEQEQQLLEHLQRHPDEYHLASYRQ